MSETNSEPITPGTEPSKPTAEMAPQAPADQAVTLASDTELKATDPNVAAERPHEERKVYGTAKTENLRDSGWWRIALPAFVVLLCVALFVVPLVILGTLLVESLGANSVTGSHGASLSWLWITMIVVEAALALLIARGLLKIFLTQAGNYRS